MNPRAMVGQARKLGDIARFAFGEPVHVAIDMDCNKYTVERKPEIRYEVYIAAHDDGEGARFCSENWKDVLSLITWLEDVEATTSFRTR